MPRIKKQVKNSSTNDSDQPVRTGPKVKTFQLVKGMKDVMPQSQKYWNSIRKQVSEIAWMHGFARLDVPILEQTALFKRSIGDNTDIVEKEMYSFIDKGNENVTMRPEGTAGVVRAYVEHGMVNLPQPVKLFYMGPMFRYDKPQAGRYRQFYQAGFEVLGDEHPVIDAQLVLMAYNIVKNLGLSPIIQVNSIGCPDCRAEYKKQLSSYYRNKKSSLCADCKKRLTKNPLRLLDCKEKGCQDMREEAPQLVDHLCDGCKEHFIKVLEFLDELELPYTLNPYLVRGLDYYTKTVFELCLEEENSENVSQNALGGGGRYDNLVEILGGRPTPAAGFSLGIERIVIGLKEKNVRVDDIYKADVFFAQLGEQAKMKAIVFFEDLIKNGIKVTEFFSKGGLKSQLEIANKMGVKYTLILGQKEVIDGTIIIRDMEAGIQEIVDIKKAVLVLKKKLEKSKIEAVTNGHSKEIKIQNT